MSDKLANAISALMQCTSGDKRAVLKRLTPEERKQLERALSPKRAEPARPAQRSRPKHDFQGLSAPLLKHLRAAAEDPEGPMTEAGRDALLLLSAQTPGAPQ